jgi:hypothetical protein
LLCESIFSVVFRLLSRHAALCYPWRLSDTCSYV